MKKLLPVIVLWVAFSSVSCKKLIEKKQYDVIIDAMTNGVWYVEQYLEGTTNITGDFLNYEFQFYENKTVTGTKDAAVTPGTWEGNVTDYTITASFPGAGDPVQKLNGVWALKDTYWDYVEAEQMIGGVKMTLHLRKKS